MAKYALGYVLVLLMVALVGVIAFGAPVGLRLPWVAFGGGVDVERAVPVPEREILPPDVGQLAPPDLIVTDVNGSTSRSPISYCWSQFDSTVCSESAGLLPGSEAGFVATPDQPVILDFQMMWNVNLHVVPQGQECPEFSVDLPQTWEVELGDLGPPGEYQVWISASGLRGDASWVIRVDSQTLLSDGAGCQSGNEASTSST